MNLPFGDHTGSRLAYGSSTTRTVAFEATSTTRTPNLVPSTLWNTIRRESGDHRGRRCATASETSVETCSGLRPRASTVQMRRGPAHDASTAIRDPSGENDG